MGGVSLRAVPQGAGVDGGGWDADGAGLSYQVLGKLSKALGLEGGGGDGGGGQRRQTCLLVEGDPTRDLRALEKIVAVFRAGERVR